VSMDDEGWSSDPWDAVDDTAAGAASQLPPPPAPPAPPQGAAAPPYQPPAGSHPAGSSPAGQGRRPPPKVLGAIIAAAVLVVGGVIAAVVLSGHHSPTPASDTATSSGSNTSAGTNAPSSTNSGSSTTPTSTSSSGTPLVNDTQFDTCQDVSAADRGISGVTDEVVCTGSDVQSEGGIAIFYASFPTSTQAAGYIQELSSGASQSSDCQSVTIGTGAGDVSCAFQDDDTESGQAVMYIGPEFTFGPNGATSEVDCQYYGQPTNDGATVLAWEYQGTPDIGALISCSESASALGSMRTGLYSGDLELNGQ
jgi:hypothetical protein